MSELEKIKSNIIVNYDAKSCGIGYIMVGKRMGEYNNEIYFIEKTSRNDPEERIKEWKNRKMLFSVKTQMVNGAEKELHRLLKQFRISRKSKTNENNETEWFNFENVKLADNKSAFYCLKELVKYVCEKYDEMFKTKIENINKININLCSKEKLQTLPGIGPAFALAIVNFRKNRKFESIADIKLVPGIKEARFNNVKNLITI